MIICQRLYVRDYLPASSHTWVWNREMLKVEKPGGRGQLGELTSTVTATSEPAFGNLDPLPSQSQPVCTALDIALRCGLLE